jgi:hypothetical protein
MQEEVLEEADTKRSGHFNSSPMNFGNDLDEELNKSPAEQHKMFVNVKIGANPALLHEETYKVIDGVTKSQ